MSTCRVLLLVFFCSLWQLLSGREMTHRGGLWVWVCMALWQNNPHRVSVYRQNTQDSGGHVLFKFEWHLGLWTLKLWHGLFLSWGSNSTCVSRISNNTLVKQQIPPWVFVFMPLEEQMLSSCCIMYHHQSSIQNVYQNDCKEKNTSNIDL